MDIKKQHNLNIGEEIVSLDANVSFSVIEINFVNDMKLIKLLPDVYVIKKGRNKIIILNMTNRESSEIDLFKYVGTAYITKARLIDNNFNSINLFINRIALQIWNVLGLEEWDNLSRDWEHIDFNGNNAKHKYIHKKTTYDNESRKFTTTKEIRKK